MKNLVDLHTHSTASDGSLSPHDLVTEAKKAGLLAIALSDHDTLSGIATAKKAAEKAEIELIPAVELSAQYLCEIHILGYYVDENDPKLLGALTDLQTERKARNLRMISRLQEIGKDITLSEVTGFSPDGVITRAHFAKALVKKGYANSISEAFELYLDEGKPAFVPRDKMTAKDAISLVKNAGGIPVLAHPFQYTNDPIEVENMICTLKQDGILGMECYYSEYDLSQKNILLEIARRQGMLITGGSDFHGSYKPKLMIGKGYGDLEVPYDTLQALKDAKGLL